MTDRNGPESAEERNLRILLSSACQGAAPPLPEGLPSQLASRARGDSSARIDLPLAAAGCAALGLVLLAMLPLLPSGRTDLRVWAWIVPAVNILLGPFAAYVVIRNIKREATHAKT
jgi:hypothetical protein